MKLKNGHKNNPKVTRGSQYGKAEKKFLHFKTITVFRKTLWASHQDTNNAWTVVSTVLLDKQEDQLSQRDHKTFCISWNPVIQQVIIIVLHKRLSYRRERMRHAMSIEILYGKSHYIGLE